MTDYSKDPASAAGARVEEFLEGEQLGVGGSAIVHRAVHATFGGVFALKRWRTGLSADQHRKFLDECSLQWRLSEHPNIVRLYWAGVGEDEAPWLAMELFDCSLADRLDQTPRLSLSEALSVADDLLAGLAAVHQSRHVHRDVKPANVLLKQGRAALSDFGISKHLDGWTSDRAAGSAGYTAPEVGRGQEPTYRSDVYSAGVTIAAAVGQEVPGWLEPVLVRATSFAPQDRPADAAALRSALLAARPPDIDETDKNVETPSGENLRLRPRRSRRLRRPRRKPSRALIGIASVITLLLVIGSVALALGRSPSFTARMRAAQTASPSVDLGPSGPGSVPSMTSGAPVTPSVSGSSGSDDISGSLMSSPGSSARTRQLVGGQASHTGSPVSTARRSTPTTDRTPKAPARTTAVDNSAATVTWTPCSSSPGRCSAGQRMVAGQELTTGNYVLQLQNDGNLVLYAPGHTAIWASGTSGTGVVLEMQQDGNLVLYASGHQQIWASHTAGAGVDLELQDDGNLVLYESGHHAIWSRHDA